MFPADYFESAKLFAERAKQVPLELETHPIRATGPGLEPLAIDVARQSASPNAPCLIVTSGIHGVEGFMGAAVQLEILRHWVERGLPPNVNVVFAHALNPFGYSHCRRFDENNVDLNRNFLSADESYDHPAEVYAKFNGFLNPPSKPPRIDWFYLQALAVILRWGYGTAANAIAQGQYQFPQGMFYGGDRPSEATMILQREFLGWVQQSSDVLHIDFHTGLGKWGQTQLLLDQSLKAEQRHALISLFGESSLSHFESGDVLYRAQGGYGRWCCEKAGDRNYIYLCAETGTYPSLKVLAGLRRENRATHWAKDDPALTAKYRRQLLELFIPADKLWRDQVLARGVDLANKSINWLISRC